MSPAIPWQGDPDAHQAFCAFVRWYCHREIGFVPRLSPDDDFREPAVRERRARIGTRLTRLLVIDSLADWADAPMRDRLWMSDGTDPVGVYSFTEAFESLVGGSGLGRALDKGEAVFTAEIDAELAELVQLLRGFDEDRPVEEQLVDPILAEATDVATQALYRAVHEQMINTPPHEPDERPISTA